MYFSSDDFLALFLRAVPPRQYEPVTVVNRDDKLGHRDQPPGIRAENTSVYGNLAQVKLVLAAYQGRRLGSREVYDVNGRIVSNSRQ